MKDRIVKLDNVFQTAQEMRRLVYSYWSDLGRWLDVSFLEFFNHVCNLPYVADPDDVETVSRPAYTLNPDYMPRDCDDKAVLLASWFYGHGRPCRFIASSTRFDQELQHVFIQVIDGVFFDATYKEFANKFGFYPYFPKITRIETLTGWLE